MTDSSSAGACPRIQHQDDLAKYAPPGHAGTVNIRLCDRTFCEGFEMVLGEIAPGGEARKHRHEVEHQAIYVLQGRARVTLADAPPVDCPPGAILRLPPGLDHHVLSLGPEPLKLLMVYSPPLPERDDTPLRDKRANPA